MIKTLTRFFSLWLPAIILFISCGPGEGSQAQANADTMSVAGINDPGQLMRLDSLLRMDPTQHSLFNERALLYLSNGKMNEALRDISQALSLKPDHPEYLITLSDVYLGLDQPQKTRETLLKVLSLDARNTNAMLKLAELSLFYRDYEGVKSYASRALELDASQAQAYFILGFMSKETGDTTGAIRYFRMTTDRDPEHLHALMQLGLLMAAASDPLAEEYYKRALVLDPSSIETLYNLGMYYQEQEMFNEAMGTYHQILRIDPTFRMAWYNLGYIHLAYLGVYQESVKYFSEAIKVDPGYFEALYNRGYAYELMGDVINARRDYQRALQVSPNYSLAVEGLNRLDQIERQ